MKHQALVNQPTFETPRLVLRPIRLSDKGLLQVARADERVARTTLSIPHPLPPGATDAFIQRALSEKRTEDVWIMDGSACDLPEVVGCIALQRLDRNQSEISYWLSAAFWNIGLAREAVGVLLTENPHGSDALFGAVFQDNLAAARVLTHCDFAYLGDAEAYSVARDATLATWTYSKKMG